MFTREARTAALRRLSRIEAHHTPFFVSAPLASPPRHHQLSSAAAAATSTSTGPAAGGVLDDAMLAKLGSLSTQALVDGLWVMGWPTAFIEGARPLSPGQKCSGRAVVRRLRAPCRSSWCTQLVVDS